MTATHADQAVGRRFDLGELMRRSPVVGPLIALVVAIIVFSASTSTFLELDNLSLVVEQSLVIGVLALGQTLIILTNGIDLANASAMVLATLIMAMLVATQATSAWVALLAGVVTTVVIGLAVGLLVTRAKLPPFIVTLGLFTILTAVGRLYASGQSVPIHGGLLAWLGTERYLFGGIPVTYGMTLALIMYIVVGYALIRTSWGKHVYAVGNAPEAARLSGINVQRTVLSVYLIAGLIYGIAAWLSLGRVPNADPNAFETGNLESITAVVIGGTSLFGGRGGVGGTLVGALIVTVLQSGLTQLGVDDLYQDVAIGSLVIVAVGVDRYARRRQA